VDWDNMCTYLLRVSKRSFSPIELERAFNTQVNKKVVGKPITHELLPALAKYIEEMTRYLQYKDFEAERKRNEKVAKDLRERAARNPKK
jgi:hypothetical protein